MMTFALMTTGTFSQNVRKLFSELKLVTDNLSLKKGTVTQVERKKKILVEVLRNNCQFCNLIGLYHSLGITPKKSDFIHQTVSHQEVHAGLAQD